MRPDRNVKRMRSIIPLIIISLCITSCKEDSNPSQLELKFYDGAKLEQVTPFISEGNNIVFERFYVAQESELIADDEFQDNVFLEIPIDENTDRFKYTGNDLVALPFVYRYSCFCVPVDYQVMKSGEIEGKKKRNGEWEVEANITFEYGYIQDNDSIPLEENLTMTFSGNFSSANIP